MKTPAKFDKKTKEKILERDWNKCIICWYTPHSIHHVYFGTESEYWEDRNNEDKGCTLCFWDHNLAHSCKRWHWVRQECINYVKKYYE